MLDLENHLVFYRSYHHERRNVIVHLIFVPVLTFTTLLLATTTGNFLDLPHIPLNGASVMTAVYLLLYYLMEPVAGLLMTPVVVGGLWYLNQLHEQYGQQAILVAGLVNIASWVAQISSHAVFEGRAPALKDNFFQALFLAPFFVWFELLFGLGYRPELHQRIEDKTVKAIEKWKASLENNGTTK